GGRLVTAPPDGEHAGLFRGLPNSYGTLGYVVSLTVDLHPVGRYVALRHVPFPGPGGAADAAEAIAAIHRDRAYRGERVDFLDGTVFGANEQYLTLGRFTDDPAAPPSDYTRQRIYYRSL